MEISLEIFAFLSSKSGKKFHKFFKVLSVFFMVYHIKDLMRWIT